jgi:hypothetical protein
MADGMWRVSIVTLILALIAGILVPVSANMRSEMARESAEYIMRKFGKEVGKDTVETLTEKLTSLGMRHGDEAIVALRKVGPRGLQIIADAGEHAADVVRLMTQFGEEAAWVLSRPRGLAIFLQHGDDGVRILIKHRAVAEPLVARFGEAAVHAFNPLTPQNGRRLAMLVDEGTIIQGSRASEVLDVVAKGGDKAMEFIWNNKGALAVTAGLTAFLAQPQTFIDGTKDLAEIVSRPATQAAKEIGREIGRRTNWTVVIIAAMGLGTACLGGQRWLKNRARLQAAFPVAQKAAHS